MLTRLIVLGQALLPLDSIPKVGAALGYSKATSYRVAQREGWPLHGNRVIVPRLMDELGIRYEPEQAAR
jgi:hypothetical protein